MPVIPIAAFLAGALLSLLLPTALLIALVVWYMRSVVESVPSGRDELADAAPAVHEPSIGGDAAAGL